LSVTEWHRQFKEGEKCKITQVGSQKYREQMQMWTKYTNTGALRSKIRCETNSRRRLQKSVQRKRPELWLDKRIFHHYNAPAHDALKVCKSLAKKSITKMADPPYSHDLAPCDFWLFSKLKNALKGQIFANIPDIQHNYCKVCLKRIFKAVSGIGTIVSGSA
jgi:transposase